MMRKFIVKRALIIFVIIVIICVFDLWVSYNWITVTIYHVDNPKIDDEIRIIMLADLHDHEFGKKNSRLISKVIKQRPDIVVLNGDMLNKDSENAEIVVELIKGLKEAMPTIPIFYSLGNHEIAYIKNDHPDFSNLIENLGVAVLNNEPTDVDVKGNNLHIGGLYEYCFITGMQSDEANVRMKNYQNTFMNTDQDIAYQIMCAHRPESFYCWNTADEWNIDLVLSGHLHGGQVIVPFIGGLYSNLEHFWPQYDFGHYKLGKNKNIDMVISRGLGSNIKKLPRFNNPPEIVVTVVHSSK